MLPNGNRENISNGICLEVGGASVKAVLTVAAVASGVCARRPTGISQNIGRSERATILIIGAPIRTGIGEDYSISLSPSENNLPLTEKQKAAIYLRRWAGWKDMVVRYNSGIMELLPPQECGRGCCGVRTRAV